jgi:prepilin peptidase CpaA
MDQFFFMTAVAVAVAAAVSDVSTRRIPNWLTYPALLAGLLLRFSFQGWSGLRSALLGMLVAGGIFMLFYMIRAMGAGDVKLMAAVGCLAGSHWVVGILLASAIAGGAMAVVLMISKGRVSVTLRRVLSVVAFHSTHGLKPHPEINLADQSALRLPYGAAIACGTAYVFVAATAWR